MEGVIVAVISGVFSVVAVVITCVSSNKRIEKQLEINQAVQNTKIEELTREVRKHNDFASRIPVIEEKIKHLENNAA